MAHFAKLDEHNVVIDVNVVSNDCLNPNNEEASGIAFLTDWSGGYTNGVKTSYNAASNGFRYNYAGIGYTSPTFVITPVSGGTGASATPTIVSGTQAVITPSFNKHLLILGMAFSLSV